MLKSDSLRVGVFFCYAFAVDLAGANKIIFRNCIRNKFLHLISRVSTDSLYFFSLLLVQNQQKHTPDVCSDLHIWVLQEWITWEQSPNDGDVIFPKYSIVCRIILKVMSVI